MKWAFDVGIRFDKEEGGIFRRQRYRETRHARISPDTVCPVLRAIASDGFLQLNKRAYHDKNEENRVTPREQGAPVIALSVPVMVMSNSFPRVEKKRPVLSRVKDEHH